MRSKDSTRYYAQIDSAITLIQNHRSTMTASTIFKVLSEELNRLSGLNYAKKVLIINSDLMENSFINFYDDSTIQKIVESPEKVSELMLSKYPISDLTGIDVLIVYIPKDKEDNTRFEVLSGFYRNLLESLGAKVHIVGNL